MGAPEITPCSLPNATMLPEKVTVPISTPRAMMNNAASPSVSPALSARQYSPTATNADAPPPRPLNIPTICGIAVIFTMRAAAAPMAEPTTMPARISS